MFFIALLGLNQLKLTIVQYSELFTHHLKNKLKCIKIIKLHQQNVNKKQQLRTQNDVVLKIGLKVNESNRQIKKLSRLIHENHETP